MPQLFAISSHEFIELVYTRPDLRHACVTRIVAEVETAVLPVGLGVEVEVRGLFRTLHKVVVSIAVFATFTVLFWLRSLLGFMSNAVAVAVFLGRQAGPAEVGAAATPPVKFKHHQSGLCC